MSDARMPTQVDVYGSKRRQRFSDDPIVLMLFLFTLRCLDSVTYVAAYEVAP